jgi:hypothetical protein
MRIDGKGAFWICVWDVWSMILNRLWEFCRGQAFVFNVQRK